MWITFKGSWWVPWIHVYNLCPHAHTHVFSEDEIHNFRQILKKAKLKESLASKGDCRVSRSYTNLCLHFNQAKDEKLSNANRTSCDNGNVLYGRCPKIVAIGPHVVTEHSKCGWWQRRTELLVLFKCINLYSSSHTWLMATVLNITERVGLGRKTSQREQNIQWSKTFHDELRSEPDNKTYPAMLSMAGAGEGHTLGHNTEKVQMPKDKRGWARLRLT